MSFGDESVCDELIWSVQLIELVLDDARSVWRIGCEEAFKQPKIYGADINADEVDIIRNLRSLKCLDYVGLCESDPAHCKKVRVRKSVHVFVLPFHFGIDNSESK